MHDIIIIIELWPFIFISPSALPESVMDQLSLKCGAGYSSRFGVKDTELLPGWQRENSGSLSKYTVWYDGQGKRYKSSVEVEHAIRNLAAASASELETETGGETSEFESSPAKSVGQEIHIHNIMGV